MIASSRQELTLNRAKLAVLLHQEFGLSERDASGIVKTYFEYICESLEHGENVKIQDFGTLSVVARKTQSKNEELELGKLDGSQSDEEFDNSKTAKRVKFVPSKKLLNRIAKFAGPGIE